MIGDWWMTGGATIRVMERATGDGVDHRADPTGLPASIGAEPAFVTVADLRPEGDGVTCLRPLGLCELGGACDACWYRPDHPRHRG
jgi:hypothetical protein